MNSIVIGLGFGDEGKGTIVDYLTRRDKAKLVVRFNGGPQAGHNVVVSGGPHHCFSQWGSGTLAGADTFLSRFMLISLGALLEEEAALLKAGVVFPASKLFVDRDAIVITPFQVALNQIRELSRTSRHGSCGRGVGEAVSDNITHPETTIRVKDLEDLITLGHKLRQNQAHKIQQFVNEVRGSAPGPSIGDRNVTSFLETLYESRNTYAEIMYNAFLELKDRGLQVVDRAWLTTREGPIIFEGAQGVLLDQDVGFHPYTTWSKTTFDNALQLGRDANLQDHVQKIGVLRTYHTRHGAGPFPTDDPNMRPTSGEHNTYGRWQGVFRCGPFDATLARYALDITGPVALALTHCDAIDQPRSVVRVSPRYRVGIDMHLGDLVHQEWLGLKLMSVEPIINRLEPGINTFIDWVQSQLNTPVSIVSHGPSGEHKNDLEYASYIKSQ